MKTIRDDSLINFAIKWYEGNNEELRENERMQWYGAALMGDPKYFLPHWKLPDVKSGRDYFDDVIHDLNEIPKDELVEPIIEDDTQALEDTRSKHLLEDAERRNNFSKAPLYSLENTEKWGGFLAYQ